MSTYSNLKEEKPGEKVIQKEKINSKSKEKLKISKEKIIIGKYSDAPDYLKDNEYIKDGYLINCHSFKLVFRSIFVCSNETINIWSHLIGYILSILLIILVSFYLKTGKLKELSVIEYDEVKLKTNKVITTLIKDLEIKNDYNVNISHYIDRIKMNSEKLIYNLGSRSTLLTNIEKYLEKNDNLIFQIRELSNNSKIPDKLSREWQICSNELKNYMNKYLINNIKGEDIGRWPLFIMLFSAMICFFFSTSFHWFSIYSKELYSFLCRLDYVGITLLIPGSCFPPYYYFYYCEKCK